jgi:hypothetical protein
MRPVLYGHMKLRAQLYETQIVCVSQFQAEDLRGSGRLIATVSTCLKSL